MTSSMTAFVQVKNDDIIWEIRSVNHRYLDVSFRIPESFRAIETPLRAIVKTNISRGKLDCTLHISNGEACSNVALDEELLGTLKNLQDLITKKTGARPTANALDLLRWPGVVKELTLDRTEQLNVAERLFEHGIEQLQSVRKSEGKALGSIVEEKLELLAQKVNTIRDKTPKILADYQKKLKSRVAQLTSEFDEGRLEQELVFIANKFDIAEEVDRLDTHIQEIRKILQSEDSIGRRLDFLMQELNREANTLSSKTLSSGNSLSAVDMKVLIEQMREQIQNIE